MGKTVISEQLFPEIVERYNSGGKTEVYDFLRIRFKIKRPYFVMRRIRECGKYIYDMESDRFSEIESSTADEVFMNLDELCSTNAVRKQKTSVESEAKPAAMEKLIHELISDRLLILSRYISLDSSTRTILIDQTSLAMDGYQVVTH